MLAGVQPNCRQRKLSSRLWTCPRLPTDYRTLVRIHFLSPYWYAPTTAIWLVHLACLTSLSCVCREPFVPDTMFSPVLQHFYQCLQHRALNPDDPMPPLLDDLQQYVQSHQPRLFAHMQHTGCPFPRGLIWLLLHLATHRIDNTDYNVTAILIYLGG